jgi:hypothetical protein
VAAHQPNLRLFGDSDSRSQYGYRLITGAYTASLLRMTFGLAPRIEWDTRIKGRGAVGIGEAAELIHHAQIAWMPATERRRYALTGPPPPDWFTELRPAPWITGRMIAEGRKLAGVSLVRAGGAAVPVPPGQQPSLPAQTPPDVPLVVPPPDTAPLPAAPAWPHATAAAGSPVPAGEADLIVGIADAARFLGYDKPDSFRRARTPIPGETRTPDGRPAWTPRALRNWHAQRKIAGNRTRQPD